MARTPTQKAPEPVLGSELIAKQRYTDRAFQEREWQCMWMKVWLMGPRLQDLREVGDYVCEEIGSESVIFVRSDADTLRAFYNVCPHRGNRLRNEGPGRIRSFRCSYHFFDFHLDGSLKQVPDAEAFTQGIDCQHVRMKELRTGSWGGWLWFSFDPDAPSLEEYLGVLPEHLDAYHFEQQWLVNDKTIVWECNWKTSVDAFNEIYHVQAIHPQLLEMLDDVNVQIDLYERHNRYLVPFGVLSPRVPDQQSLTGPLEEMMRAAGIDPERFEGKAQDVRAALIRANARKAADRGIDLSELSPDQLVDDYHYYIFPNVTLNVHATGVMVFRQRPHPTDPNRMYFDLTNLVRVPPGSEAARPEHTNHKHGEVSLGLVLDHDAWNLPRVQQGMRSAGFEGLFVSHAERRIRHMHETLDRYLLAGSQG